MVEGTIKTMLTLNSVGIPSLWMILVLVLFASISAQTATRAIEDRSFIISRSRNSSNDRTIVRTIITMAQSLNIDVIAEGVETEAQREIFTRARLYHYQGFLFWQSLAGD